MSRGIARAKSEFEQLLGIVVLIVLLPFVGLYKLCRMWSRCNSKNKRLSYLVEKYQDENLAQRLVSGSIWEGQSEEQLRDSLGSPVAVDNKRLKTKTREVWKYDQTGVNRFALRVTMENGFVSGWDQKTQDVAQPDRFNHWYG